MSDFTHPKPIKPLTTPFADDDAELSLDLSDLEELPLLNLLIILLIVTENNHNFILNQFKNIRELQKNILRVQKILF